MDLHPDSSETLKLQSNIKITERNIHNIDEINKTGAYFMDNLDFKVSSLKSSDSSLF